MPAIHTTAKAKTSTTTTPAALRQFLIERKPTYTAADRAAILRDGTATDGTFSRHEMETAALERYGPALLLAEFRKLDALETLRGGDDDGAALYAFLILTPSVRRAIEEVEQPALRRRREVTFSLPEYLIAVLEMERRRLSELHGVPVDLDEALETLLVEVVPAEGEDLFAAEDAFPGFIDAADHEQLEPDNWLKQTRLAEYAESRRQWAN